MIKRNISYHISEDRLDRACYIMETVGLGEIIKEVRDTDAHGRVSWQCLTDTGVVMVISKDTYKGKRLLITTYVGTIDKASAMFKSTGHSRLPSFVSTAILKANKKRMEK